LGMAGSPREGLGGVPGFVVARAVAGAAGAALVTETATAAGSFDPGLVTCEPRLDRTTVTRKATATASVTSATARSRRECGCGWCCGCPPGIAIGGCDTGPSKGSRIVNLE